MNILLTPEEQDLYDEVYTTSERYGLGADEDAWFAVLDQREALAPIVAMAMPK